MTATFHKARPNAPAGFFDCEAAGLRWLAEAGGARVVRVLAVDHDGLALERLAPAPATLRAAEAFGRDLARTHAAGAPAFGSPPPGWAGDGFFGPLHEPLPMPAHASASWGTFYADARVVAARDQLGSRGRLSPALRAGLDSLADRLRDGAYDDDLPPARLHGDLWSGNVMWTAAGAVLIDPAAHGGHPLTDLAMLALFGLPHLDRVLAAYAEAAGRLDPDLVGLHQVYPVAIHAVLFGGGYTDDLGALLRRYA